MATRRITRKKQSKVKQQSKNLFAPGPCQCRPRVGSVRPVHGCLPEAELRMIGERHLQIGGAVSAKTLRTQISKKLGVKETDEYSFVQAAPIPQKEKDRLQKEYLRPPQPADWKSDPDKWLDSNNIMDVMKQYEEDLSDFQFLGPYPIDFAAPDPYGADKKKCLISEICKIDIPGLRSRGIHRIGIVYNLDPHNKGGSHWIASFIDLKKNHCYYFDSYGMKVPDQIAKFMQWLTLQEPKMKLFYNARRFQFSGSECGMYSMYFIIRMLIGEAFQPFCRRAPRDGLMLSLRSWLFST